jgi:hypothetical protein
MLSFTIRWGSVPARGRRYPHQTEGWVQMAFSRYGNIDQEET